MGRYIAAIGSSRGSSSSSGSPCSSSSSPASSATRSKFMLPLSAHRGAARRLRTRRSASTDSHPRASSSTFLGDLVRLDFGESTYVRGSRRLVVVLRLPAPTRSSWSRSACCSRSCSPAARLLAAPRPGGPLDRLLDHAQPRSACRCRSSSSASVLLHRTSPSSCRWFETGPGPWTHHLDPARRSCLALPAIGRLAMVVRSSMIDELNTQYVKAAKAKGMSHPAHRRRARPAQRRRSRTSRCSAGRSSARWPATPSSSRRCSPGPGSASWRTTAINEQDFFLIQAIVFVVAVMVVVINIVDRLVYKCRSIPRCTLAAWIRWSSIVGPDDVHDPDEHSAQLARRRDRARAAGRGAASTVARSRSAAVRSGGLFREPRARQAGFARRWSSSWSSSARRDLRPVDRAARPEPGDAARAPMHPAGVAGRRHVEPSARHRLAGLRRARRG